MQANGVQTREVAIVLGGGGSRGALQAGALRALWECGYRPNLLVGTSAGAINAAFVGVHGFSANALDQLDRAWRQAAELDLLPSNYVWATLRSVLRSSAGSPASRIREYFVANGVTAELRFADLAGPQVIIVSTDLNSGKPVLHGSGPDDSVLDALLMSTALPPWFLPVKQDGHYLMDGAVVSGLPIEPAIRCGAKEIVALDLTDPRDTFGQANGFGIFLSSLTYAIEERQVDLELQVARGQGIPVRHLRLNSTEPVPVWNFRHTAELLSQGYEIAMRALRQEAISESA